MGLQAGSVRLYASERSMDISMWREASDNARQEALETRLPIILAPMKRRASSCSMGVSKSMCSLSSNFSSMWLEGVFRIAAGECEPLARLLAEARWHFFMRKSGEFAESADAPERECLIVIEFEMEGADGDGCKRVRFATSWNNGDAAGEFGFDAGGVEVGADGDGGAKAGCGDGVAQTVSDLIGWSEEAFGAGDVEDKGSTRSRRRSLQCRERTGRWYSRRYCAGCGFGLWGAGEDVDVAELFDF